MDIYIYIDIYYTLIPDFNSTLVLRLFEELCCLVIYDDISQLMGFGIPVGCCRGYILPINVGSYVYIIIIITIIIIIVLIIITITVIIII